MPEAQPAAKATPSPLYRYVILLIGFVTLAGANGVSSAFQVFYAALLEVFDWSHAGGASPYAVNQVVLAAGAPLMGWLLDRFGPRGLFSAAAALVGLAWMACGTLQTLGQFILFYGIFSALGQTALSLAMVVVSRWFPQAQRGRAIGLADVGTGVGHVVLVPGCAWLITAVGWRAAFVVVGAAVLALLVPLNLLHRPAPSPGGLPHLRAATLQGALRTRALWTLCLAHLCMTVTMTMVNVHLVNFLVGTGTLQVLGASTVYSALSAVSLGGRLFFGWLADRLRGEGAFTAAMSCTMTGYAMLLLLAALQEPWPLYAFVVCYGFAQGAGGIAIAAKTVEVFQGPRLGTIFMLVTLSGNLGAAFGAWLGGRLVDVTGSYTLTFLAAIVSGGLAIGGMWAGGTPPRAAAGSPHTDPRSPSEGRPR
jgi:predicted MFS family arabinose efflux permease